MPDQSKPNHYSHDSLGDPYTCTEDHNHPESNRTKWAKLDRTEKLLVVLVCAVFAGAAGLVGYTLGYGLAALIRLAF